MTEVSFSTQFLTALDSRPIKLSSDHIADARNYPAQPPLILPKLPSPPHPSRPTRKQPAAASADSTTATSTSTPTITITLKPMKSGPPISTLPNITAAKTSIYDLKQSYSTLISLPLSKIKILWKKKPVSDAKTVAEVVGEDAGENVEFSVMVMGGGAAAGGSASGAASPAVTSPPVAVPTEVEKVLAGGSVPPAAQGPSGKDVVAQQEFWDDLKGFVVQRIRDESEGERLAGLFKGAWEKSR